MGHRICVKFIEGRRENKSKSTENRIEYNRENY